MENLNLIMILGSVVFGVVFFAIVKTIKSKARAKRIQTIDEECEEYFGSNEADFYTIQEFFSPENSLHTEEVSYTTELSKREKKKKRKTNKKKYKEAKKEIKEDNTFFIETNAHIEDNFKPHIQDDIKDIIYKRQSEIDNSENNQNKSNFVKTEFFLSFDQDTTPVVRPAYSYTSLNGYKMLYDVDLILRREGSKEIFIDKNNKNNSITISKSYFSLKGLIEEYLTMYDIDTENVFKVQIGKNNTVGIGMLVHQDNNSLLAIYCVDIDDVCRSFELRFTREEASIWANRFKAMLDSVEFDKKYMI